ncbi:MAG: hypothetical protein WCA08_21960, partial [Desulfoferrobacter sp.]
IKWEIFSEYGFSARIGRTLEKTGCSVAHLDSDFFEPTVQRLLGGCPRIGLLALSRHSGGR